MATVDSSVWGMARMRFVVAADGRLVYESNDLRDAYMHYHRAMAWPRLDVVELADLDGGYSSGGRKTCRLARYIPEKGIQE